MALLTKEYESLSRSEIAEKLADAYDASRITVIRVLNELLAQDLIQILGSGPATRYKATSITRILRSIDVDAYFAAAQDDRYLVGTDNATFFKELKATPLLSDREIKHVDDVNKHFRERIADRADEVYRRELHRFTVDLAWKSSRIEGNTYSLLETEELLSTLRGASGRTELETLMILNHKKALDRIMANASSYRPLKTTSVFDIHALLTANLGITPGVRTRPVGIVGTNYLPSGTAEVLKREVKQAVAVANAKQHPVEAALVISGLIAYLQPFIDGNKRTARLVANALLLAHEYAPISYRSVNEVAYKKAVLLIDEQQCFSVYKEVFLEQFEFAAENYFI